MKQNENWSKFWAQGHVTTFGEFFKDGYRGEIGQWWDAVLQSFPEGGQVVDLGCGNTALLTAILDAGLQLQYIGVDPAAVSINPRASALLVESMFPPKLLAGYGAESVPLESGSVDAVVSVFGIEYAELSEAIPEVSRLLVPEGRFDWVVHHADSIVSRMSKRAIQEYNATEIEGVISALKTISAEAVRVGLSGLKNSALAEAAREEINTLAARYLNDTDLNTGNGTMFEFLTSALKFFRVLKSPEPDRVAFISNLAQEFEAYHARFSQMLSVVKSADDMEQLTQLCSQHQLSVLDLKTLNDEQGILGWIVSGKKVSV